MPVGEKREIVVVSSGGAPHDLNMIQAHKALDMASRACLEGGTIIFLAECPNGLGRDDFIDWFESQSSEDLASRLCENYQVNGQTAWSLLKKTERFKVKIVTALAEGVCESMRMEKVDADSAFENLDEGLSGYILPFGAKFLVS